jgi:hypothetical protein
MQRILSLGAMIFVLVGAVLLTLVTMCFATQSSNAKSEPLKGIKCFTIVAEVFYKNADVTDLTDRIQMQIDLRLRGEGILIDQSIRNQPTIYVNVILFHSAYSTSIEVFEPVLLERNKSIRCVAITWHRNSATSVSSISPDDVIRSLDKLIDYFLNDYFTANQNK